MDDGQLLLMATPEQQSSPATAQPMLVKKLNSVAFYDELILSSA